VAPYIFTYYYWRQCYILSLNHVITVVIFDYFPLFRKPFYYL